MGENMIVHEDSLIVPHVLCVEDTLPHMMWYEAGTGLMEDLNQEDIYCTSPLTFQSEKAAHDEFGKYTFYYGLNTEVEPPYFAKKLSVLEIHPALKVRCADVIDIADAYDALEKYARDQRLRINPNYYHVCFEVAGIPGIIMDIYAEMIRGR